MLAAGMIPQNARIAESAAEALRAIQDQAWDKVYLDYDLKGEGNGGDAARALLAATWKPSTVHLHTTSTSGGLEMRDLLEPAGFDVVWVPINKLLPDQGLD